MSQERLDEEQEANTTLLIQVRTLCHHVEDRSFFNVLPIKKKNAVAPRMHPDFSGQRGQECVSEAVT